MDQDKATNIHSSSYQYYRTTPIGINPKEAFGEL
jgi:hypothetical protein